MGGTACRFLTAGGQTGRLRSRPQEAEAARRRGPALSGPWQRRDSSPSQSSWGDTSADLWAQIASWCSATRLAKLSRLQGKGAWLLLRRGSQRPLKAESGRPIARSWASSEAFLTDKREITKSTFSSFLQRDRDMSGAEQVIKGGREMPSLGIVGLARAFPGGRGDHRGTLQTAHFILKEKENHLRARRQPERGPPPRPRQGNGLPWQLQVASLRIFKTLGVWRPGFRDWKTGRGRGSAGRPRAAEVWANARTLPSEASPHGQGVFIVFPRTTEEGTSCPYVVLNVPIRQNIEKQADRQL